jgi:hypothetical protein
MFFLPLRSDLTHEQRTMIFDTVEPKSFLFLRMVGLEIDDRREGRSQIRGWSKQCSPLRADGDIELLEVDERRDDTQAQPFGFALRLEAGPIAVPRDELQMPETSWSGMRFRTTSSSGSLPSWTGTT